MKKLEEYMALPYAKVIFLDEDMEGNVCFRAEHPELPGCMSHGKTPKEAVQNLEEARRLYIETRMDLGLEIPVPAVITTGTNYSSAETIVITPVSRLVIAPAVSANLEVETNLPKSYDFMAEKVA